MKNNIVRITNILILLVIMISGCRKKNQSPYTPYTPSGPVIGIDSTYYLFSSLAIDPNDDSVALRFEWDNGDTTNWSFWVGTGEIVYMRNFWSDSGNYYLKVQAMDIKGYTSEWSLPHCITITQNRAPNTPSIPVGCTLGHIDETYQFSSWTIDPDSDSLAIRYDWGDGDASDWSPWVLSSDSVKMSHSWHHPDTYYIKAQAKDIHEATSEWSLSHSIIVMPDTGDTFHNRPPFPPSVPAGPSSGYGSTYYQFSSSAIDPDTDLVSIRFAWGDGDTSDWSQLVPSGDSVSMVHAWLEPDTYYVTAQARDIWGDSSDWSEGHLIEIISGRRNPSGRIDDKRNLLLRTDPESLMRQKLDYFRAFPINEFQLNKPLGKASSAWKYLNHELDRKRKDR